MNHSPWIAQLNHSRPAEPLEENLDTDIVVIGGGIAGVTTAYFLLTKTDKRVVLLEANKIAHGATGHNAGQISSYYEKSLTELVKRFGPEKAVHAQRIIEEDARVLLGQIFNHAQLTTPRSEFVGYNACASKEHIYTYLEEWHLRRELGMTLRPFYISRQWLESHTISSQYKELYTPIAQRDLLALLETDNTLYIGAAPFLSGCMNSALFSEELVGYLLATYKDRFVLKEYTPVSKVVLNTDDVLIEAGPNTISAEEAVLCTNGFEFLTIINTEGEDIDKAFHEEVRGLIGYMGAYKEPLSRMPFAGCYANPDEPIGELYYYVTRRPFEDATKQKHNLVCIGGPEGYIPDRGTYDAKKEYPLEVSDGIETFMLQTYNTHISLEYKWHGLMGYTKSGVRIIGREKKNKNLLYNLGCNGVGILTSVYGADRIARIVLGEVLEETIFDPK
jgi:glycine/D-amino acid oxidase-like deaminating enzyme